MHVHSYDTIIEPFIKSAFPRRASLSSSACPAASACMRLAVTLLVAHASACRSTPLLGRLELAATDPDGRLSFHSACTKVYVDVGAFNYGGYVDELVAPGLPHDVCVLAFELRIDAWASLIARGVSGRGTAKHKSALPLGHFHPRGVALPYALSNEDGEGMLNVAVADGCSSLLPPRTRASDLSEYAATNPSQRHVNGSCTDVEAVRHVPTVTLRTVLLSWLPARVRASRLKVDAQGMDIAIVESAGRAALAALDEITLETYPTDCPPFYEGQPMCSAVLRRMSSLGFRPASTKFAQLGDGVPPWRCKKQRIRLCTRLRVLPAPPPQAPSSSRA